MLQEHDIVVVVVDVVGERWASKERCQLQAGAKALGALGRAAAVVWDVELAVGSSAAGQRQPAPAGAKPLPSGAAGAPPSVVCAVEIAVGKWTG